MARLSGQRELIRTPPGIENTPFTPDERAWIEAQLRAALDTVRHTHELTDEQYRALEDKLDYLVEAAGRFGRLDWRSIFIGSLVEVAMQHALSSDLLRDFLGLTLRGLAQLFGGVDLPALPPS